ncbi:PREDICTED: LOW QUALITY PROTEIN: regulator of nonsense transcripts 2-like, partial [Priapulus caudatus]|uniref:LOW QUALITY PROTEIN: regulator of nonsense transcripts 2-like n=1 Tax=Priapulus caudatus TaxID=37621 RepID=A0ABM1F3V8_PRICU
VSHLIRSDHDEHSNVSTILSFCKHCGEDYAGLVPRRYRLLAEKHSVTIPRSTVSHLIRSDHDEHSNVSTILSFCKHCGEDYAGLVPRRYRLLAEKHSVTIPRSTIYAAEKQRGIRNLLNDYYQSLCRHLDASHKELQAMERQNRRILHTKGELSQERRERHEAAIVAYQKLLTNTQAFSILFKDSDHAVAPPTAAETTDEALLEEEMANLEIEDAREAEEKQEGGSHEPEEAAAPAVVTDAAGAEEEVETSGGSMMKHLMDDYLGRLLQCINRDLIDKAAMDFCMNLNTKGNRRKLARCLFLVPRTRLDLLPFYARLVAALFPCVPDVATDLVPMLKSEFKFHLRKKDQLNVESKVKVVRFIGELTKFKMYTKAESLYCLKLLLFDFTHLNVEMACNLLETCGRFMFRSPDSYHRTKVYLEQMMRKKSVMHMDSRHVTMIENAFYYCNPPEVQRSQEKVRPPMHEYIRRLIYKDLSKVTIEKVLRQLRKLPWNDRDAASYTTKMLSCISNVKYNNIHCVANLLAGLVPYQEHVGPQVVDAVLEDMRLGMEVNHPRMNQRRVSGAKFLGELYNYRLVESAVVFKMLYSLVTFGGGATAADGDAVTSDLDPPEHLFRVRLVCTVLDTCGQYFDRGSSRKKLDCFLIYFQK